MSRSSCCSFSAMSDLERCRNGLSDRAAYQRIPEEVDPFWDDAQTWEDLEESP